MTKNLTYILFFCLCNAININAQFFVQTNYVGAFGTSDWTIGWTSWNPKNAAYPGTNPIIVTGEITTNTTWSKSNVYLLKGYVYVKNNATLTIQAGTIIRGDAATTGTLVITRGSKISAVGTLSEPIVFTSNQPAGSRGYGDWGGLVILGKAPINVINGTADVGAGINNANNDGVFGGTDSLDNSGILKYVRVEFAGVQYQPDKEINGITLAGVGAGTSIQHVQVSFCGNDAFRLSGGTVNLKNIVCFRVFDADISVDLGYIGNLQFGLILRDSARANAAGTSSIEVQNDGLATSAMPFSDPTFSNFTVLGPLTTLNTIYSSNYRNGIHIRRNGRIGFFNSAFAGYPKGIMLDGPGAGIQLNSGRIVIKNVIAAGNKLKTIDTTGSITAALGSTEVQSWFNTNTFNNRLLSNPKDLNLQSPYTYNAPVFLPKTGSPMLYGADFTPQRIGGFPAKIIHNNFPSTSFFVKNHYLYLLDNNRLAINTIDFYSVDGKKICTQFANKNNVYSLEKISSTVVICRINYLNNTYQTIKICDY